MTCFRRATQSRWTTGRKAMAPLSSIPCSLFGKQQAKELGESGGPPAASFNHLVKLPQHIQPRKAERQHKSLNYHPSGPSALSLGTPFKMATKESPVMGPGRRGLSQPPPARGGEPVTHNLSHACFSSTAACLGVRQETQPNSKRSWCQATTCKSDGAARPRTPFFLGFSAPGPHSSA